MYQLKKITSIFLILLVSTYLFANPQDYELDNVERQYQGTYIPVDFEYSLYQTKELYNSIRVSKKSIANKHHDVLFISQNACYSDAGFHDGYALTYDEFMDFKFITGEGGTFCIDNKGFLYRKIAKMDRDNTHGYSEYQDYVINIILSSCLNTKDIRYLPSQMQLLINKTRFSIILDGNFFDVKDVALILRCEDTYMNIKNPENESLSAIKTDDCAYMIVKDGNDGKMYSYREGKTMTAVRGDLIQSFPGMFKIDKDFIPDYSKVPKDQLRLFRNLIYARNCYSFKSADLKDYFNNCSWYKIDSNFSESNFSESDKDFISLMQKYEMKL